MTPETAFSRFVQGSGATSSHMEAFIAGWNAALDQPRLTTDATQAEVIYAIYPRKQGRGAAIKAINKALGLVDFDTLKAAVYQYAAAVAKWDEADRQFIPHPATWFNQERWTDDPKLWERQTTNKPQAKAIWTQN